MNAKQREELIDARCTARKAESWMRTMESSVLPGMALGVAALGIAAQPGRTREACFSIMVISICGFALVLVALLFRGRAAHDVAEAELALEELRARHAAEDADG